MSSLYPERVKEFFGVTAAIESVAECMRGCGDYSATTIRCAINDRFDMAQKDGYRIPRDYDQRRAVATVKRLLASN